MSYTYDERWCIFMVLYFEMHQLSWFKAKWKKTLAKLCTLLHNKYVFLMMKLIYRHVSRFKKQR